LENAGRDAGQWNHNSNTLHCRYLPNEAAILGPGWQATSDLGHGCV
jgi:hypothetical protein